MVAEEVAKGGGLARSLRFLLTTSSVKNFTTVDLIYFHGYNSLHYGNECKMVSFYCGCVQTRNILDLTYVYIVKLL